MAKAKLPSAEDGDYAGELTPAESWQALTNLPDAVLIDVRTDAEFSYVGHPDLTALGGEVKLVSWVLFPGGGGNPDFLGQLHAAAPDKTAKVMFLCRSGVRSRFAAQAATQAGYADCYNVLEGFEGDKDASGHRGTVGGWKVAGLPWKQG